MLGRESSGWMVLRMAEDFRDFIDKEGHKSAALDPQASVMVILARS